MKYSLIITAWKEPKTVKTTLEKVFDSKYRNLLDDMEVILVCPDDETRKAGTEIAEQYNFPQFRQITDQQKGKPAALNLALAAAQGEILIFTDGDITLGDKALPALVQPFEDTSVGGVTGRPISADSKDTVFGYWGNLLADGAHHKRSKEFSRNSFYYMSGYLYAIKNIDDLRFPEESLVDDAWVTLELVRRGFKIKYAPEATVLIKYPQNFSDWIKQKKRSVGGYKKLETKSETPMIKSRSIVEELKYVVFPITYARNLKEFIYSLLLYPGRLYLWFAIGWQHYIGKKNFKETWVRIESTK